MGPYEWRRLLLLLLLLAYPSISSWQACLLLVLVDFETVVSTRSGNLAAARAWPITPAGAQGFPYLTLPISKRSSRNSGSNNN